MLARVLKSTGSWYEVETEDAIIYQARIRGKIRLSGHKHTNPVAVGDWVQIDPINDTEAQITAIEPRSNYIIRRAVNLSKQTHIIASNIDMAYLLVAIRQPRSSTGFIDRFLVTAGAYDIPVTLVFNKIDLHTAEDNDEMEYLQHVYTQAGYPTMAISSIEGTNLQPIIDQLKDKVSLIAGHSGVGKSTLINQLFPGLDLKTKNISDFNRKGQHTTTHAQMYKWPFGGYIIDTPGIKEFGLVEIDRDELQDYFPEIFALKSECKFYNCQHIQEPQCAVLKAVEEGELAPDRYQSYHTFYQETDESSHTKGK
ncbi:MAG: ribosome small subunit-dependent GTPase A [Weeksellaceae bacterium]|nr:ribosome small subunit-dependent GTPase A [Weeksellaceae bacterium]